jgi:ataxin-10
MSAMSQKRATVQDADSDVMRQISELIDEMLTLSQPDADLRMYCVKFQVEHASSKAEYQSEDAKGSLGHDADDDDAPGRPASPLGADMLHLKWALQRMIDLATSISQSITSRSVRSFRETSPSMRSTTPDSPYSSETSAAPRASPSVSVEGGGSSTLGNFSGSVDEFMAMTDHDVRVELRANVMHVALEILSQSLLVHPALCTLLQEYMIDEKLLVPHLSDLMLMEKELELAYFTEGFKTDVMKLIANLTFQNHSASTAIAVDHRFLNAIFSATRIDDENPGLVEWAEFAIRNICSASPAARDHLAKLQPSALLAQSSAFLGNPDYQFDASGKLHIKKR